MNPMGSRSGEDILRALVEKVLPLLSELVDCMIWMILFCFLLVWLGHMLVGSLLIEMVEGLHLPKDKLKVPKLS